MSEQPHPEQDHFADPESIEIMGVREDRNGTITEADVLFQDRAGKPWYVTVVTGDEFVTGTLQEIAKAEPEDITDGRPPEPPKLVWNHPLEETELVHLIGQMPQALLQPFLVEVKEDED